MGRRGARHSGFMQITARNWRPHRRGPQTRPEDHRPLLVTYAEAAAWNRQLDHGFLRPRTCDRSSPTTPGQGADAAVASLTRRRAIKPSPEAIDHVSLCVDVTVFEPISPPGAPCACPAAAAQGGVHQNPARTPATTTIYISFSQALALERAFAKPGAEHCRPIHRRRRRRPWQRISQLELLSAGQPARSLSTHLARRDVYCRPPASAPSRLATVGSGVVNGHPRRRLATCATRACSSRVRVRFSKLVDRSGEGGVYGSAMESR